MMCFMCPVQAVLYRAERLVESGDLAGAALELEKLEGKPAEVVRDWVQEARKRAILSPMQ